MQGEADNITAALAKGDLASAEVSEPHRALLTFVELLTRHSQRATDQDVDRLRRAGFTDAQIAEAVYITAMFAMFNRVADAFGLLDQGPPLPSG